MKTQESLMTIIGLIVITLCLPAVFLWLPFISGEHLGFGYVLMALFPILPFALSVLPTTFGRKLVAIGVSTVLTIGAGIVSYPETLQELGMTGIVMSTLLEVLLPYVLIFAVGIGFQKALSNIVRKFKEKHRGSTLAD